MAKTSTPKKNVGSKSKSDEKVNAATLEKAIQVLLLKGKNKQQIAVDDIVSKLPKGAYTPEQLDEIILRLNEKHIQIIDKERGTNYDYPHRHQRLWTHWQKRISCHPSG